jgi:hypothetical protein
VAADFRGVVDVDLVVAKVGEANAIMKDYGFVFNPFLVGFSVGSNVYGDVYVLKAFHVELELDYLFRQVAIDTGD